MTRPAEAQMNSWRQAWAGRPRAPSVAGMGLYQVTCASTEICAADGMLSHVKRIGLAGPDAPNTADVGVARLMLSSGDTLTVGDRGDEAAELRKGRCPACGAPTLRTRKKDAEDLSSLPPCG